MKQHGTPDEKALFRIFELFRVGPLIIQEDGSVGVLPMDLPGKPLQDMLKVATDLEQLRQQGKFGILLTPSELIALADHMANDRITLQRRSDRLAPWPVGEFAEAAPMRVLAMSLDTALDAWKHQTGEELVSVPAILVWMRDAIQWYVEQPGRLPGQRV